MSAKTARELLVPIENYPHAAASTSLAAAIDILEAAQINIGGRLSMPRVLLVFGADDELLGMVRRRDILHGIEPEFGAELGASHPEAHVSQDVDPNLSALISDIDADQLAQKLDRPLSEIVRPLEAAVDIDDSFMRVVRELVSKDTHLAVVLDAGKVAGVVRSLDALDVVREKNA